MDTLPSSEFRKQFARLTARTEVTVNGHPIGTWVPVGVAPGGGEAIAPPAVRPAAGGRDVRGFTPAPKPSQGRSGPG